MTDDTQPDDVPHRRAYHPAADRIRVRELGDGEDGLFTVRMPIASGGEVRNDGDDPLSRDELDGMRQQIGTRSPSVFLDHGDGPGGSRYSAVGKIGELAEPELVEGDGGETLLEADLRMMDPETLPAATGAVREALAAIKSQVERGLSLAASIGWADDRSSPGGVDLMETSLVGIPADPRTTSEAAPATARSAGGEEGADRDYPAPNAATRALGSPHTGRDDGDGRRGNAFYYDDRLYVVEPSDGGDGDDGAGRDRTGRRRWQ